MVVIGGTGTIGKAVIKTLKSEHEIVIVGYPDGDYQVNLGSTVSIQKMFKDINNIDGIICVEKIVPNRSQPIRLLLDCLW